MGKGIAYPIIEKEIIQDLVQQNKIVENKKTDANLMSSEIIQK